MKHISAVFDSCARCDKKVSKFALNVNAVGWTLFSSLFQVKSKWNLSLNAVICTLFFLISGETAGCDLGKVPTVFGEKHDHVWWHPAKLLDEPEEWSSHSRLPSGPFKPRDGHRAAQALCLPTTHPQLWRLVSTRPPPLGALLWSKEVISSKSDTSSVHRKITFIFPC